MTMMRRLFAVGAAVTFLGVLANSEDAGTKAPDTGTVTKPEQKGTSSQEDALTAFREGVAKTAEARRAVDARKDSLVKENAAIGALTREIEALREALLEKEKALSAAFAADHELGQLEARLAEEEDALTEARRAFRQLSSKRKP